jgi:hypothetical protein
MLSGAHGGHTISYQQLARDGVRLLGRLVDAESELLRFGPDLPANIQFADDRAARSRRAVDEYVAQAGIVAPPPDTDPAERPQRWPGSFPEALNMRTERIATVVWCTGFGPTPAGSVFRCSSPTAARRTSGASPRSPACTSPATRGCRTAAPGSSTVWPPTRRGSRSTSRRPRAAGGRAGTAAQPAGAKRGRGVTHIP